MRLFVTGATGFIGSHFVEHAIAEDHEVFALRRHPDSKSVIPWTHQPEWLDGNLQSLREQDLAGIDAIVHLAAAGVSPKVADWKELKRANISATLRLCRLAAAIDASLVVTGTFSEYGLSGSRYELIPPDAPLEPTYPYAVSKATGAVLACGFARAENIRLAWLRLFSVYGEGQYSGNLWPSLRAAALAGEDFPLTLGEQIRDFIPVKDVVRQLLAACLGRDLYLPRMPLILNIGTGRPQTVRSFCEFWWRTWDAKGSLQFGALPYRAGEVMRYVPLVEPDALRP
jgi:nucleoside-diphosphate-sugar epimerase